MLKQCISIIIVLLVVDYKAWPLIGCGAAAATDNRVAGGGSVYPRYAALCTLALSFGSATTAYSKMEVS